MNGVDDATLWFPDFCRWPAIFALLVISELVVLIMALAPGRELADPLGYVGVTSLFVQWISLTCAVVLCALRKTFDALGVILGLIGAWVAVGLITAIASLAAWTLDSFLDMGYVSDSPARLVGSNVVICALVAAAALRYFYVQQRWQGNVRAAAEAQVNALQARIRPHFLFNSMNTIASLIRTQPETAERAVEDLSELFRAALAPADVERTLGQELELCHHYLEIERLRLGERLHVAWDVAALPQELPVPPLILQPLLENALYHGIQPRPQGGTVSLKGEVDQHVWRIVIENPLPAQGKGRGVSGHGIAVANIEGRLVHCFGPRAKLRLIIGAESCRVVVEIPRHDREPRG